MMTDRRYGAMFEVDPDAGEHDRFAAGKGVIALHPLSAQQPEPESAWLLVFPEPLRPLIQQTVENFTDETGRLFLQFMAAFAHPDYMCNLSMFETLPNHFKKAATDFFEFCVLNGLSSEQRNALLRLSETCIKQSMDSERER